MNRLYTVALLLSACGGDPPGTEKDPPDPDSTPVDTDTDSDTGTETLPGRPDPWERTEEITPGPIRFNELLYHSDADPDLEWIELYNPFVFDLDLSGWSLADGVEYTFPAGTLAPAGGFVVVAADPTRVSGALGPWSGRLSDGGERVDLYNNAGRRIDSLEYGEDEPWPVGPDGAGVSLAKVDAETASDRAENWTSSPSPGGTPGAPNLVDPDAPPEVVELVPLDASWAYDLSGEYPAADWAAPDYDDGAWARGDAVFYAGASVAGATGTVRLTADNYYAVYLGAADGTDLRLVAEDLDGDWTTVEEFEVELGPQDHLLVAAWEAPWDYGGPQMTIAEVETADLLIGTDLTRFEWVLGPTDGCPGTTPPDPAPPEAEVAALVAAAEADGTWQSPGVEADRSSDPWGWANSAWFDPGTHYVWADTFSDTSVTNVENTYVLLRSVTPVLDDRGATELGTVPTTTTFRTSFPFEGDPAGASLVLDCVLDDGAVIYLNGVEVHRENLPGGALTADTLASSEVGEGGTVSVEVDAAALVRGTNVLAAELHQAARDDTDLSFGCALTATLTAASDTPPVVLSEVPGASTRPWWVELLGVASSASLDGLVLASSGGGELELGADTLAAGERHVVEELGFEVEPGDVLTLWSAGRGRLLDAVRVEGTLRGRIDGDGPWRYPTKPSPGAENPVELVEDVVINELQYHHASVSREGEAVVEVPEEWIELYNRGAATVDLGDWQLVDAVAYRFPEGTTLAPGAYLVVAGDAAALQADHPDVAVVGDFEGRLDNRSDRVRLLDARGNPADEVRYHDGGRWPEAADGGGSTLELRDPRADNTVAEAWAASDESGRASWATYTWRGTANPSVVGPDGTWEELVLGLLDAGELLLDDISVVEDPSGAAHQVIQNGGFDDGTAHWRLLGTHRHAEVVPDPDNPSNPVLRLRATGPTGHMHNHAETTLLRPIATREYEISFRARWVSGSNQLNTRLYFNRLARTLRIEAPDGGGTPGAPNSAAEPNPGPTFADLDVDQAVPAEGQSVQVEVSVADPDGVAGVTLHTSVDGAAFEATAMTEGDPGRWQARIEGQSAGSVVQLHVEATDGAGAVASFPAAGPDSRALLTWDDGRAASNGLHNFRILLTAADSAWLHEDVNLMSDDYVGATVIVDESTVYWDVGVRAKGSERGRPEVLRLGYAVRFGAEAPFRGTHRTVLIDRSEGVGYGQREVLMNLAMTGAGSVSGEYNDLVQAITPQAVHTGPAELQLDRATDLVLDAQFADGADGPMFEYELVYYPYTTDDGTAEGLKLPQPDGVVGNAVTDLGDDPESWRWTFLLQNNERVDDYSQLMELGEVFARSGAPFLDRADEVIDVDQWLRGFAFATLSGAGDNYGGDGSWHNARFYLRPEDGRFLYFPHDLDYVWSSQMPVVGNGDLSRLLQDPVWLRGYYGHLQDIIGRAYNEDYLGPWCDRLASLTGQDFAGHCRFVGDRADWVMYGASDSVMNRFPARDFRITTGDGADLEVEGTELTLEGEAWIDVRGIRLDGAADPLTVTWLDEVRWQVVVPVVKGSQEVVLSATDLRGEVVGTDSVGVTSGG